MATIEERRKALLTKKLDEMGKMGVTHRTAENSPFYDQPIEEASAQGLLEERDGVDALDTETSSPPNPIEKTMPSTEASSKQQKRSKTTKSREDFAEYQQIFLAPKVLESKTQFSLSRDTVTLLKIILQDLGSRTTLTAYIENILRDHISEYRDLINQVTAKRRRKETIPE
ncbi:DUF3408 domain-containing protein [Porphyromonas levii]|uniref:DUF3408 domain-containing protein n=1 Tax=Porphyromonas levii TaxID=28114 RepID=A0A4Y8WN03_9PORP|nr:DUF3408 domain-containing protein [Porphyromonas levii]TFH94115.1 DUF3408 domain-containing protein [Porphyromonas levii]TFH94643.1 DUF3408 domain-containing protein [Porphyromonas levii]